LGVLIGDPRDYIGLLKDANAYMVLFTARTTGNATPRLNELSRVKNEETADPDAESPAVIQD
jgi:hypothetical protein